MLLLSFNDLRLDQHGVLEKTCDFLGLDSACTREWLGRLGPMHANLSVDNANLLTAMRNSLFLQQLKTNVPLSIKISWKYVERLLSAKIPAANRSSGWKPDVDSINQIKRTLRPNMHRLADDFDVDINAWFGDGWLI